MSISGSMVYSHLFLDMFATRRAIRENSDISGKYTSRLSKPILWAWYVGGDAMRVEVSDSSQPMMCYPYL
jgi:hypothetical protein